jgi:hypothetical protein
VETTEKILGDSIFGVWRKKECPNISFGLVNVWLSSH